ncbi:phage-like protein [Isoalcanivorax pacificus W11-5]|uniref:Phage-like protein n=1 Tax=Isoalcanivorax pacificus W11-5 TaxID=391936 RepID=A0A0B4XPH9_9GAMM|nr:phage-like protein [Isoalcanivorax pacificus W11-5]
MIIKKADFGAERQKFFRQFAATKVLEWNTVTSNIEDSREHFYIAVERAINRSSDKFEKHISKNIKRYISRDLATVITFNDEGSKALERRIKDHLGEESDSIRWLYSDSLAENEMSGSASVLVIAGAITSGRSLLSISRKLRCIDPLASIVYLVGFSKLPTQAAHDQLRKDLSQGGHELIVLARCPVPRIKEHTKTSWDWEREVLQPYTDDDPLGDATVRLPGLLTNRQESIARYSSDPNGLFLPDHAGNPLRLRRTFAFWSDLGFSEQRLTNTRQADAYWTIQCVLHDLRNKSENDGLATTYHITLISPANFDRYNDGIIQACILRSALPVEMDYRVDHAFSRRMADVIFSVINNWNNDQGEAALEFLMALWTRRLQLINEHLREVCALKSDEMSEDIRFIFDRLTEFPEIRA